MCVVFVGTCVCVCVCEDVERLRRRRKGEAVGGRTEGGGSTQPCREIRSCGIVELGEREEKKKGSRKQMDTVCVCVRVCGCVCVCEVYLSFIAATF